MDACFFENIPPAMAFLVVISVYTDMESRDKESNDMARYRTVNDYSTTLKTEPSIKSSSPNKTDSPDSDTHT